MISSTTQLQASPGSPVWSTPTVMLVSRHADSDRVGDALSNLSQYSSKHVSEFSSQYTKRPCEAQAEFSLCKVRSSGGHAPPSLSTRGNDKVPLIATAYGRLDAETLLL